MIESLHLAEKYGPSLDEVRECAAMLERLERKLDAYRVRVVEADEMGMDFKDRAEAAEAALAEARKELIEAEATFKTIATECDFWPKGSAAAARLRIASFLNPEPAGEERTDG
jgi:hypothetical protein